MAANDDIVRGIIQASSITFPVTANTPYQIDVDGFNSNDGLGADNGGITLNFNFVATAGIAPTIIGQPANATVIVGGNASFSVTASGSAPFSYQWLFKGAPISGATGSTYSITNATTSQAGSYSVTVSNATGTATSAEVTLTVNTAPATPVVLPSGGGGGGAPSLWFVAVLSALGLGRLWQRGRR